MNNADMARVLREVIAAFHACGQAAGPVNIMQRRAAELDAQKMPGTLDIPGVKDYVNATPPVPDQNLSAVPSNEGAGGSGPAAGHISFVHSVPDHCDRITWRGKYYHLPITQPAAPATDAALDEAMGWLQHFGPWAGNYEMAKAILSHIRQQAERIAELMDANKDLSAHIAGDEKKKILWNALVVQQDMGAERDALRAENERKDKALAAADVVCHTSFYGGPDNENAAVLDDYWHARGGTDACTVCNPSAPKDAP